MKKIILAVFIVCVCCSSQAQTKISQPIDKKLSYKIIPVANNTWGYDIYNDDKLFVHQPSVPAIAGTNGFSSKENAEKVAKKVIEKISQGQNPPTITVIEMKELGVIPKQ